MRKNMTRVIDAFKLGEPAVGDSKRTCWTDGTTVYSYRMPIARRLKGGAICIVAYSTAPTATTRSQVSALQTAFSRYSEVPGLWTPEYKEVATLDPGYTFYPINGGYRS